MDTPYILTIVQCRRNLSFKNRHYLREMCIALNKNYCTEKSAVVSGWLQSTQVFEVSILYTQFYLSAVLAQRSECHCTGGLHLRTFAISDDIFCALFATSIAHYFRTQTGAISAMKSATFSSVTFKRYKVLSSNVQNTWIMQWTFCSFSFH